MKIAFVIGVYPFQIGGAEMQATEIAKSLKKIGHDIYFISYSNKVYTSPLFKVSIIPIKPHLDLFYLTTKKHIYLALDKIKPDIIYHRAYVPFSHFIARWAKKHKVPFYFHSADIYTLTQSNFHPINFIKNRLLSYTLKSASGVICQNEEQKLLLEKYNIHSLKKIYNIHSTCPQWYETNPAKLKGVAWIGKFTSIKNPALFIQLAHFYEKEDIPFYMFVSRSPDPIIYKELLEEICKTKNLKLIVGKDNEFINKFLLEECRILVNTSLSEGISNTFIQAWMRGIPVLSYNSNPDAWFSNYNIGYFCNCDKRNLFLGLKILYNKIIDEDYRKNIVEFAVQNFSEEIIIPQLSNFMKI